jgi:glutamate decarboxylase
LPPKLDDVEVLRIVVREGFSRDMADNLILDLTAAVAKLGQSPPAKPTKKPHSRLKNKVC